MDAVNIDLSRERRERLEDTHARFGVIWRQQALRRLGVSVLYAAAVGVAMLLLIYCSMAALAVFSPWGTVVVPRWVPGAALVLTGFMLLYLVRPHVRSLFSPAPRAGRSPDETIRQFFEPLLEVITHSVLYPGPWLQAWVCLLDQVKEKEHDYRTFVSRRQRSGQETRSLLQREAMRSHQINPSRWSHINLSWEKGKSAWPAIVEVGRSGGLITYQVSATIGATYMFPGNSTLSDHVRWVQLVKLAQVGERWYLAALPSGDKAE